MIEGEEQANEEIHEQQEVLMNENENGSLYRLCGGILLKGRAVAKTSKFLPAAFSSLYGIYVVPEDDSNPGSIHWECSLQVDRAYQKYMKHSPDSSLNLPEIKKVQRRFIFQIKKEEEIPAGFVQKKKRK